MRRRLLSLECEGELSAAMMTESLAALSAIEGVKGAVDHRRAVIDIGSNSVRLVVYDGPLRAPFPICNEKALCGLGRDMGPDRLMRPDAMEAALSTLARFRRLLKDFGDPPVSCVATAAVREAHNGPDFVEKAARLGFPVDVLSGQREATLAANGVLCFEPEASGIVGDMGGGSLELIRVHQGEVRAPISLPIGPLSLMQRFGDDQSAANKAVRAALKEVRWPAKQEKPSDRAPSTLYIVGGAWRAVARVHMEWRQHPLSVLHHYDMPAREVVDVCAFIAQQSRQSLEDIKGVPRRRIETLPLAAIVLKDVIEASGVELITVSAGGLREGLLYEQLAAGARLTDPLIAGAAYMGGRLSPDCAYGEEAIAATERTFTDETASERRLRHTALQLMDIGAFFHPDLRALHAFQTPLRGTFYAVSHKERAMLATALYVRHEGAAHLPEKSVMSLMNEREVQWAVRMGLVMRFLGSFAPKAPTLLRGCVLHQEKDAIIFTAPRDREALWEGAQQRRLDALATAFGVAGQEVRFVEHEPALSFL